MNLASLLLLVGSGYVIQASFGNSQGFMPSMYNNLPEYNSFYPPSMGSMNDGSGYSSTSFYHRPSLFHHRHCHCNRRPNNQWMFPQRQQSFFNGINPFGYHKRHWLDYSDVDWNRRDRRLMRIDNAIDSFFRYKVLHPRDFREHQFAYRSLAPIITASYQIPYLPSHHRRFHRSPPGIIMALMVDGTGDTCGSADTIGE